MGQAAGGLRPHVLDHMRGLTGAWNRHDERLLREQPRQRELRPAAARLAGNRSVLVEEPQVLRVILRGEARHGATDVARLELVGVAQLTAEEPSRERTERDERHAELAAGVEHRDLRVARPERILALDRRHRVHGMRLAQRRGGDLRQADRPDLPLVHQIRQRPDAVRDRHVRILAVQVIQIDHVGLQARQAVIAHAPQCVRARVDRPPARLVAEHPALAGQHDIGAMRLEDGAEELLVGAESIEGGGVEHRDAALERRAQDAFRHIPWRRRGVGVAQVHAPEPEGRDAERAEPA